MKDKTVYYYGNKYDWEDILYAMNDELRERVRAELGDCTPEEFLKRYAELDETIYDYIEVCGRRVFVSSYDDYL